MLSPKELRSKLDGVLTSSDVVSSLEISLRNGDFDVIPEINAIVSLGDGDHMHKNVWEHTKHVVAGTPNLVEMRWSALLHDIGKAPTRRFDRGRVTFMNHDVVGERMVRSIAARTKLFDDDPKLLSFISTLVLQHLRPPGYGPTWTDSAVRRLVTDCGGPEIFSSLLDLSRADLTTRIAAKRERALRRANALQQHAMKLLAEDSLPKLPKGTMGIIIERSGKRPGPWVNEIQRELLAKLHAGTIDRGATAEMIAAMVDL